MRGEQGFILNMKIGGKGKALIIALVFVALSMLYYRVYYAPKASELNDLVEELDDTRERRGKIEADCPDVEKEKEAVENLKQQHAVLSKSLTKLEFELIDETDIPELLDTLIKNCKRAGASFNYAKPEEEKYLTITGEIKASKEAWQEAKKVEGKKDAAKKKSGVEEQLLYKILPIRMGFVSSYDQAALCIKSIEYISPYIRVSRLKMIIDQEKGERPEVDLTISILLGKGKGGAKEESEKIFLSIKEIEKNISLNPFATEGMPFEEGESLDLRLNGIIWKDGKPLAMINEGIYKVGDIVSGKKIVTIEDTQVILQGKGKKYTLSTIQEAREAD